MVMKRLANGLDNVKGISTLGKHVGIKQGKKDFGVIFSEKICNCSAVYTKNKVKGAPLYVDMKHLANKQAQAIVVNSGIANVCTGKKGIKDSEDICLAVAKELGIKKPDVIPSSTGLIGAYLPINKIKKNIKDLKPGKNSKDFATAIMTTDTKIKQVAVKVENCVVAGVAKGSGMIHPNMATMLSYIVTDAFIPKDKIDSMLKKAVDKSFNMISVDKDTSTSDTVVLMANGLGGRVSLDKLQKAIDYVCIELAKMVAEDGEGATKLIECNVTGKGASKAAKAVISSNLLKCAIFGEDPNWGRIMCAIGNSGAEIHINKTIIKINKIVVYNKNPIKYDYKKLKRSLKKKNIVIDVDLGKGKQKATAYGCDMTYDYVEINAAYHT